MPEDHDSFEYHFHDTVAGGDWLCEQDVVDYFVHHCPTEMTQLEQWGCPWSRRPDGSVNVRRFGGMKIERTGLPPTKPASTCCIPSSRPPFSFPKFSALTNISSLTCWSMTGRPAASVAMNMMEGTLVQIRANAVVLATGGAGRVYRYNTNGGIVTGDGMGMATGPWRAAARHGIRSVSPDRPAGLRDPDDRRLPRRRRDSGQQKRLPLSAGLRHGPGNPARRTEE
ncbi:FAD-binding protein [Klebsiella pneumoniae]|uniref:FAD-binding protein n=1 Tax=Klebsiella pneumoniae TaxID=573 RepID=A0A927HTE8_KLEPN|nr:FAD-binding protein [Klebsiella pneumoniae]MBD3721299.1 FAD-binding protein [Klebsiella pneumoniae]